MKVFSVLSVTSVLLLPGCGRSAPDPPAEPARPSILIVTLDTTRADAIGPDAQGVRTPSFNAVAARGRLFRQAYAPAPETLPSHASMMTGLYPGGHGVHENGRFVPAQHPLLAERLQQSGYRTAAFVSSFVLAGRFGLARGFDRYDDEFKGERSARETTDRAIAYLEQGVDRPLLLWVHYFDPHAPYEPPEPFRTEFASNPYLGEVAAMDAELGRLLAAFEQRAPGPTAVIIAADHGEGLGDHGEALHGNLVYNSTMHVPMVIAGPGVPAGATDEPASIRRIFHTVLDWAGIPDGRAATEGGVAEPQSLRHPSREIVLGEAMKPFLSYGWRPQVMAVEGRHKAIYAGQLEVYDVIADPAEAQDIAASFALSPEIRTALEDYPVPSLASAAQPQALNDEARRQLASLGYVGATTPPVVRKDAPRPVDMVGLFDTIDRASTLFVQGRYAQVIPLLETIVGADPHNLDAAMRLASAHSHLGNDAEALKAFDRAAAVAPESPDVPLYRALHDARGRNWARAAPVLERVVERTPDRLAAVEGLAFVRERQGRIDDAIALWQRVHQLREPSSTEAARLGLMAMGIGDTPTAIASLERARALDAEGFRHDLELGVLYLDAKRLDESRMALDRVPASHPEFPMALFKRAQVSVLLDEPDRAERIERARKAADATTRRLIAREKLFAR